MGTSRIIIIIIKFLQNNTMKSSTTENHCDNLSRYSRLPALSKKGSIRLKAFPFRNGRKNWISQKTIFLAALAVLACVTFVVLSFCSNAHHDVLESSGHRRLNFLNILVV